MNKRRGGGSVGLMALLGQIPDDFTLAESANYKRYIVNYYVPENIIELKCIRGFTWNNTSITLYGYTGNSRSTFNFGMMNGRYRCTERTTGALIEMNVTNDGVQLKLVTGSIPSPIDTILVLVDIHRYEYFIPVTNQPVHLELRDSSRYVDFYQVQLFQDEDGVISRLQMVGSANLGQSASFYWFMNGDNNIDWNVTDSQFPKNVQFQSASTASLITFLSGTNGNINVNPVMPIEKGKLYVFDRNNI